jgi:alpha-mannosidase
MARSQAAKKAVKKISKTVAVSTEAAASLNRACSEARHELERFQSQASFVEGLCGLHAREAPRWLRLLDKARGVVGRAAAGGSPAALRRAVREAEGVLRPVARTAKTYTVHCVGHAHIDMNWMWGWPETVAITNDTFSTVLRLMEEYPDFRFSQSQASVYAIVKQYNPAMLEEIRRRVAEGRWEVTASHWVECDKNLSGGEALCRHLLYTRRYMQKLFGLSPEDVPVDWSPDTFGHAATVPSYLVRGGVKYLYLHRPGVHLEKKPGAFWWQAPDGARVLVRNDMKLGYNGIIAPAVAGHLIESARETGSTETMFVYGVGDHGGGPTRRDIHRTLEMNAWPVFPNVLFSTARRFFESFERSSAKLPVLDTELNTEFTGCYTSQSLIKKCNRQGESRLSDAEAAAAAAWTAVGAPYPSAALTEAWCDTLFSHFHDILPGSGVHDTRTYTHGLHQKTMAATGMIETLALRRLAAAVDTSSAKVGSLAGTPGGLIVSALGAGVGFESTDGCLSGAEGSAGQGDRPFVVFNPTAWERREVVKATIWNTAIGGQGSKALKDRTFSVRTPEGETLPVQLVNHGHYWGHDFAGLSFPAKVPPMGYALYTIVEAPPPTRPAGEEARQLGWVHHCSYSGNERSREGLESSRLRMELDTTTGGIRSLVDKASDTALVVAEHPAPPLEFGVERPHGMTAWVIDHTGPVELPELLAVRRKLSGPYRASLEVDLRVRQSRFTLTYELRAGDPRLHLHLKGTWFERGTPETGVPVLRLAVPLALSKATARYEIPFGAIDRPYVSGEEMPALRWAQVTGLAGKRPAGCLLLNDSKYGYSLDGGTLRLTLIRSSYEPDTLPEIGQHEVRMALQPFAGEMPVDAAIRAGTGLNHPLRAVGTDVHAGTLPGAAGLLSLQPDNAVLCGLKKAEDSEALILRLYETAGKKTTVRLRFDPRLAGEVAEAVEIDLLERPVTGGAVRRVGPATVEARLPPRGIVSLAVRLLGSGAG